jgi:hypothetical protein
MCVANIDLRAEAERVGGGKTYADLIHEAATWWHLHNKLTVSDAIAKQTGKIAVDAYREDRHVTSWVKAYIRAELHLPEEKRTLAAA